MPVTASDSLPDYKEAVIEALLDLAIEIEQSRNPNIEVTMSQDWRGEYSMWTSSGPVAAVHSKELSVKLDEVLMDATSLQKALEWDRSRGRAMV